MTVQISSNLVTMNFNTITYHLFFPIDSCNDPAECICVDENTIKQSGDLVYAKVESSSGLALKMMQLPARENDEHVHLGLKFMDGHWWRCVGAAN